MLFWLCFEDFGDAFNGSLKCEKPHFDRKNTWFYEHPILTIVVKVILFFGLEGIKKALKIETCFRSNFGTILLPFWEDFGSLGGSWGSQDGSRNRKNRKNMRSKKSPKKRHVGPHP